MQCLGCQEDRKILAQGLCSACYSRLRRKGTIERTNVVNRGKTCSVEGCNEPALSRSLCRSHYDEAEHPLKTTWKTIRNRAVSAGVAYPKEWNRFEGFVDAVGRSPGLGYQLRRKDSTQEYSAENLHWIEPVSTDRPGWSKEDKTAYARAWNHKRNFDLSPPEYDAMLRAQNFVCAVCQRPETQILRKTGKLKALAVDHDHVTKEVRGLLCTRCNQLLGSAKDDPQILREAADYLDRTKRTHEVPEPPA